MAIKLSPIFSSGMVLTQNPVISGYSDDENIEIEFLEQKYNAKTDSKGFWKIELKSLPIGGPYEMNIGNMKLIDVYVGYVWLCNGQSNMELPISRVRIKYENELKDVKNDFIRAFNVRQKYDFNKPTELTEGKWVAADTDIIDDFYAAPYFFARKLYEDYKVPIGIIECAMGGSSVQSWMNEESLKDFPNILKELEPCKVNGYEENLNAEREKAFSNWYRDLNKKDIGIKDEYKKLNAFSDWKKRELTAPWKNDIGEISGSVWFKKEFNLSKQAADNAAKLILGRIVDSDYTYVNGKYVGRVEYQYPPRIYDIDEDILKEEKNTITVRVLSENNMGCFVEGKDYVLKTADGDIDLDGEWFYKVGAETEPIGYFEEIYKKPTGLYNGMLATVLDYMIDGILWYQGESNTDNPQIYSDLLKEYLKFLRKNYGEDTPFMYVQLPNFDAGNGNENWEILRKEQEKLLSEKNTGMVIARDIGEYNDLHPLNKKDIGERLAYIAKKLVFNENVEHDKVLFGKH